MIQTCSRRCRIQMQLCRCKGVGPLDCMPLLTWISYLPLVSGWSDPDRF